MGVWSLILNKGPTLSRRGVDRWLRGETAPVTYQGPALTAMPVLPFQVFGVHYQHDVVIMSDPAVTGWSMHEYARTAVRVDGELRHVWIAKDSDLDGVQTVTTAAEHMPGNLDDVPVPRNPREVVATERITDARLELELAYTNHRGQRVEVTFSSVRAPRPPLGLRNGDTFDHSERVVSAVIDIARKTMHGSKATILLRRRAGPAAEAARPADGLAAGADPGGLRGGVDGAAPRRGSRVLAGPEHPDRPVAGRA